MMKRTALYALCVALTLFAACSKADKEQLAGLEKDKASLEANTSGLPDAAVPGDSRPFTISFDKEFYGVDASCSVSLHYTLSRPATLETVASGSWTVSISPSSRTEGEIMVSVPEVAASENVLVKATDDTGNVTSTRLPLMLRRPYVAGGSPALDAMAYNGFPDRLATEENFQKLVEAGITMISVEGEDQVYGPGWRDQCRKAEAAGIKVVLFMGYSWQRYLEDPNSKLLENLINEAKSYPAICAYQIIDEPSAVRVNELKRVKDKIRELDPTRPVYINLHPSSVSQAGMGAATYEQYVETFATVCNLEFITFDQYPVFTWGVEGSWYKSLDVVSSIARSHGIPFWAFLLCCREQQRAVPTLENIRLQGNIDIAYGAQCIQYFVWKNTTGTDYAPIMDNGEYKPVYYDCKEYNREMHNREFVFAGSDVWKIRHAGLGSYRHGIYLSPADYPEAISDIAIDGDALVSFVANNGSEYVAVCNKTWQEKLPVNITFAKSVFTIDREGAFAEHLPGAEPFVIDEGDMLVIKWK